MESISESDAIKILDHISYALSDESKVKKSYTLGISSIETVMVIREIVDDWKSGKIKSDDALHMILVLLRPEDNAIKEMMGDSYDK